MRSEIDRIEHRAELLSKTFTKLRKRSKRKKNCLYNQRFLDTCCLEELAKGLSSRLR